MKVIEKLFIHMQIQSDSIVAVMRSFHGEALLLSSFLISSMFIITDCSTCKKESRNDVNEMKSFKNLSGNALEKAIVDEIAEQSKINLQIHLRHLGISRVTKSMLKNISNIYSIDFQTNKITEIENGSFSLSEKLEKIDLMENHLTKITKYIFSGNFHALREINLSFNAIDVIESGSFDGFVNLESIDIASNCITHLHSDLFKKCSELKQVLLSNNRIKNIGNGIFMSRTELNVLDLSHNQLDFIPKFKAKHIKFLDTSYNNIKKLDLNFESSHERKKLAKVEELNVAHNSITKCVQMREMRNDIIRLDMSHNQINDLNNFPILLNMEVLELSHNNVSHVSKHKIRERFPSLKVLNMRANKFDCEEYNILHESIPNVAIFVDLNCSHVNSEKSMLDAIQSKNDEIVRQLQLNRNILIIILSVLAMLITLPITFLLYTHLRNSRTVKYIKDEFLIDQIEL